MPELPEVETVCRGLAPLMVGARFAEVVARRADLRLPLPEKLGARLHGKRVEQVRRRAKYGLIDLDDGQCLLFHLGMSGSMRLMAAGAPPATHDHVLFRLDNEVRVHFHDPRRFGMLDLIAAGGLPDHPQLRGLGPEPLGNGFSGPALGRALAHSRAPVKVALLDQRRVAGLGNIYVCEALHMAGISPWRAAASLDDEMVAGLAQAIRLVLEAAIKAGGSSLRDHARVDGELGYFQHQFRVYGRAGDGCPTASCGGGIVRAVQAGRSTFYCPDCQR